MKLFGGNFSKGFITGLAESVDKQLKDDMDRTFERADRAADYHIRRAAAEQERYDKEMRDVEGLLKSFAGLVGGDLDKAAQLYNAGGGNVERASVFYDTLLDAKKKMPEFDINTAIPFAESKAGEFGMADYLGSLVSRPKEFAASQLPDSTTGGVGLFRAFKPGAAISRDISEQVSQAIPTSTRDFKEMDIATPTVDYSKMPEAMIFDREQEMADYQLENAILTNRKLDADIAAIGKMDGGSYTRSFDRVLKIAMQEAGSLYDPKTGQLKIITSGDNYKKTIAAFDNTIKSMTQRAVETGAANLPDVNNAIYTAGSMIKPYLTMEKGKVNSVPLFDPDAKDHVVGRIYGVTFDGKLSMAIYLGPDNFIKLD